MRARRYVIAMAAVAAGLSALTGVVNWWVDPFGRLGNNVFGFYVSTEREAKSRLVLTYPHDALIMGSSKVAFVDPGQLSGHAFFNAAFSAASPEEIYHFFKRYGHGIRRALIGLDFFMFNEREFPISRTDPFDPDGLSTWYEYVLSLNVLKGSATTVYSWLGDAAPKIQSNGQRNTEDAFVRHAAATDGDRIAILKVLKARHFRNYVYSDYRVKMSRNLKSLLDQRGIPYTVFINPLSREVLTLLEGLPAGRDFARFRRDMAAIFPRLADVSDSEWSAPSLFFSHDPFHYLPSTGARFLNHILDRPNRSGAAQGIETKPPPEPPPFRHTPRSAEGRS
jgi:hypothetical protein